MKNIQHSLETLHSERDKKPLTERENKFDKMLTQEHRNNSYKNLHPSHMRQKSIISLGNTLPRPASTDRLKVVVPKEPIITALYNVKMNFNINKDIINNNFLSGLSTSRLFNKTKKNNLDKIYLTSQKYKPKSKEKSVGAFWLRYFL